MTGGKKGRGGGDRHPKRVAIDMNEPPEKPADLSSSSAEKWDELLELLPRHLAPIDGIELKLISNLLVQADELAIQLANGPDPVLLRLYLNVSKQIHSFSASFGFNPYDRARLGLVDVAEPVADPFLEYLEQAKNARNN